MTVTASENAKTPMWRRIVRCIGILFAIASSVAAILISMTIALQMDSKQEISWAAKFAKSVLQDLLVTPVITTLLNYFLLKCAVVNPKAHSFVRRISNLIIIDSIVALHHTFNKKNVIIYKYYHVLTKNTFVFRLGGMEYVLYGQYK